MEEKKAKKDYFLPISLLIAAIIIAGAVIYSNGTKTNEGGAESVVSDKELALSSMDSILGSEDAPITMFEYSDYECPFCVRFYSDSKPLLVESYVNTGKANMTFRALAYHEKSPFIMNAVSCAGDQNKYWEMHNFVFDQQLSGSQVDKDAFVSQAETLGMDKAKFVSCVDNDDHRDEALSSTQTYQAAGFRATPILVIAKSVNLPAKFDANYLVSQMSSGQNVITLAEGVVAVVGAQPFAIYQSEIDKLLK